MQCVDAVLSFICLLYDMVCVFVYWAHGALCRYRCTVKVHAL